MALPDLIEMIALDKPVLAEITVPGSKSITNRALILAALADGETTLQGALWSEDTQVMVEALRKLGFEVKVEPDPEEFCNRTITVKGLGGKIPNSGTEDKPLEIFVGNAGTVARFLSAFVCLGQGVYRLHGVPRMHERPQAALFSALRELGYRIESVNDRLPATIFGTKSRKLQSLLKVAGGNKRKCVVSIKESSQFASALLLCAKRGEWDIEVYGENAEESTYVAMTSKMVKAFPASGGKFPVEPDASSGSYFWAAGWLLGVVDFENACKTAGSHQGFPPGESFGSLLQKSRVTVSHWPDSGWQLDADFTLFVEAHSRHPSVISRVHDLADSIMTAIVIAPAGSRKVQFTNLGRMRLQESERVVALRTELTYCGAKVIESDDTLEVFPSQLHGAEIETYNDHRMAMCFAILGLKVPGIKIKNPSCVKKTFPNFFQKLATLPPHGLGAEIRDAKTGRRLAVEELFAE
jgi:3-phosphoshikimate 1-carboxyvinyltransferase